MEDKKLNKKKNILFCAISLIILVLLLFPMFWTLITSFKTEKEIFILFTSVSLLFAVISFLGIIKRY